MNHIISARELKLAFCIVILLLIGIMIIRYYQLKQQEIEQDIEQIKLNH
ncbi:hypothetical protein [Penaeicola halotolerans]|nr:hypothetical protein [Penaeicola halotolerans]